jgi:hypothetical protein
MAYLLTEFLSEKGLLAQRVDVTERPDLVIYHPQLIAQGQAFEKLAIGHWMRSVYGVRLSKQITADGLERRWRKFLLTTRSKRPS